eukprot:gnl/TRDRNA2_/TRDRNA2_151702_c0_seq1.p1 gnl/TRDRNA2_/TRDRNA2_151702_c0~~gnl/TRDRNA2_/TRDRNA2_151702_c0_seq1.p1  ORF type:complete len:917 (-),score=116.72 gnl/TRDRNA2_/TRDRNA2_151702_c0_seq1:57-2807(-)
MQPCREGLWLTLGLFLFSTFVIEVGTLKANTEPNRIWPLEPKDDAETLHANANMVCDRALPLKPEEFDERDDFKPRPYPRMVDHEGILGWVLAVRNNQEYIPGAIRRLMTRCGSTGATAANPLGDGIWGDCGQAWTEYAVGLIWPMALPLFGSAIIMITHFFCCWVACCRCCRRMICCQERKEPRSATRNEFILTMFLWAGASASIFGLGTSVHELNVELALSLNWHMCTTLRLADQAVGGSEFMPSFIGLDEGENNFYDLTVAMDIDGTSMRLVRRVIQLTAEFARRQDKLRRRSVHFTRVLNMSGPAFRAFEHRCVFCSLAVGDPNNPVIGYPTEGLLPALMEQIATSGSEAMDEIRQFILERFTGTNLTFLASKVKRAHRAVSIMHKASRGALVRTWPRIIHGVDVVEAMRRGFFVLMGLGAQVGAGIGWVAFFITRVRYRNRPDLVPSGKPHCCTWCCGFCYVFWCLTFGGMMMMFSCFLGESCIVARHEILAHDSIETYAGALGLGLEAEWQDNPTRPGAEVERASVAMALDLARCCFTPNGTGEMLATLHLDKQFGFEQELTNAFYNVESRATEPPAGKDSQVLLDQLAEAATNFGSMFVLDPMPLNKSTTNGSLGVLELNANVRDLLLGSTIWPEDAKGPDQIQTVSGLNTYAELIAGPGKYAFSHGTAGGGVVITPTHPPDEDLKSLPDTVANALLYAKGKEQLLTSADALRCDELSDDGKVEQRSCSVKEFQEYVSREVNRLQAATAASTSEAAAVQGLFVSDLKVELLPTLRKVRDLRTTFRCRFLWRRFEEVDQSLCQRLVPATSRGALQLLVLAMAGTVGIIVQYKVWRHLKDNKVVGLEIGRFEQFYGKFQEEIDRLADKKNAKEEAKSAYHQDEMNDLTLEAEAQEVDGQKEDPMLDGLDGL